MTATPLPPLPPVEKEWCEDSCMYVQPAIPKYGSYEMHAYAQQARADLETENQRLRTALGDCLDWMEALRSCGDMGNWEWEDDAYTQGIAALEKQP